MIISHKYKFIFLKTNKTAGTSIEIALSKFCGSEDVITPISPEDEQIRKDLGYRSAQNYLTSIKNNQDKNLEFYNHISAKEARVLIGVKDWNNYYKFCFERNPWDRIISLYYWRYRDEPRLTLLEFIESGEPLRLKKGGFDSYTIDNKIAVDKVCLFENITEELELIRIRLGIPEKLDLPYAKSQYRKDKRSYRKILGVKEQARIAELFSDEINIFGYNY